MKGPWRALGGAALLQGVGSGVFCAGQWQVLAPSLSVRGGRRSLTPPGGWERPLLRQAGGAGSLKTFQAWNSHSFLQRPHRLQEMVTAGRSTHLLEKAIRSEGCKAEWSYRSRQI